MQICDYIYRTDRLRNLLLSIGLDSEFNLAFSSLIFRFESDCSWLMQLKHSFTNCDFPFTTCREGYFISW
ncbi:Uncharacterised protein [Streptococcus pneumoniae]|nr:Uncharacterised protein [Streptococcus pneumoniae]